VFRDFPLNLNLKPKI